MPNWCLHLTAMCALLVTSFPTVYNVIAKDACSWCGRPDGPRETIHFQHASCSSQFVLYGNVISVIPKRKGGRELHLHFNNFRFLKPEDRVRQLTTRFNASGVIVRIRSRNDQDFTVNSTYLLAGDFVKRDLMACECAVQRFDSASASPNTLHHRLAVVRLWIASCQRGCNVRTVTGVESDRRFQQDNSLGSLCKWDPDIHGHHCYKQYAVCTKQDAPTPSSKCAWTVLDSQGHLHNISTITNQRRGLAALNDRLCKELSSRA